MKYVTYYRVSTQRQGLSGLGLEAQKQSVGEFIKTRPGELIESFTEVQSGRKDDRTELLKALRKCRLSGATLLIAKLDRLSRSASFLMALKESSVSFIACDMPEANNLTVGIMALMAEHEAEMISQRTKAALAAAKARGVRLGNPNLHLVRHNDTSVATKTRIKSAKSRNMEIRSMIQEIEEEAGHKLSSRQIAAHLNEAGCTTTRGKPFSNVAVLRILAVYTQTRSDNLKI